MPCWPGRKKKLTNSSLSLVDETKPGKKSTSTAIGLDRTSFLRQYIDTHPVETAHVLEQIFSYLPINSLLSARQVCKRWNTSACAHLRDKIEGAIILQRGISYYTRVMASSLDIPIGRLFLKIDDITDPCVSTFFQGVGPSIRFLVLNLEGNSLDGFLGQVGHLRNLRQLSLNLFQEEEDPNLATAVTRKRKATSVKIWIDEYDAKQGFLAPGNILRDLDSFVLSCEPDWDSNEALLLEKLLELAPHLKNLNLTKWPFLLKPSLFSHCSFTELKFLSLKYLDDQGFIILGQGKDLPNLKTVEFELGRDVRQESFGRFLANVANSLEYMEIKSVHNPAIAFKLPGLMRELNTIRLPTWVGPVVLDSVCNQAPGLIKLQLSHVDPSQIFVKDPIKPGLSVRWLAVNFGRGSHSFKKVFKVVGSLIESFPGLKMFMMKKVSDKILEMICEGWPNLEGLRITTSFALSDSGITGLPAVALQKTGRLECGCGGGVEEIGKVRMAPYIGKLKDLRDLRIEAEQGTHFSLTNLSLHLGLSELVNLNSLRLTCHELGPHWCLKCIADNLQNLHHLTIMDRAISHDRYDEQELHYLLRKLPNLNLVFAEADSYSWAKRGSSLSPQRE